jgi:chromosome partitioning protein
MPVVVAFISQKGGVGKSTLARALAAVAVHANVKVMLGDLDAQQQTLLLWEKARKEYGIAPAIPVAAYSTVDEALACTADSDLVILDTAGCASDETCSARGPCRTANGAERR